MYVQRPVHTSNNVEAAFDFVEATFDFVATNGNTNINVENGKKNNETQMSIVLLEHCECVEINCVYYLQEATA